jgi:hypothetical protein
MRLRGCPADRNRAQPSARISGFLDYSSRHLVFPVDVCSVTGVITAALAVAFAIAVISGPIDLAAEKTETITNLFDSCHKKDLQDADRSLFDSFVIDSLPPDDAYDACFVV